MSRKLCRKGGKKVEPVKNLNDKRVCDISRDRRVVEIVHKGFCTRITANPDGTLRIKNVSKGKAA